MADDDKKTEDQAEETGDLKQGSDKDNNEPAQAQDPHPEERGVDEGSECPECGEPIENVRMTCPNCGHEYKDGEYTDEEAGHEFRAGSAVDEQGQEKEVTGDADRDEEDDSAGADSDDDDDGSNDSSTSGDND